MSSFTLKYRSKIEKFYSLTQFEKTKGIPMSFVNDNIFLRWDYLELYKNSDLKGITFNKYVSTTYADSLQMNPNYPIDIKNINRSQIRSSLIYNPLVNVKFIEKYIERFNLLDIIKSGKINRNIFDYLKERITKDGKESFILSQHPFSLNKDYSKSLEENYQLKFMSIGVNLNPNINIKDVLLNPNKYDKRMLALNPYIDPLDLELILGKTKTKYFNLKYANPNITWLELEYLEPDQNIVKNLLLNHFNTQWYVNEKICNISI